jgi:hypothetical protein
MQEIISANRRDLLKKTKEEKGQKSYTQRSGHQI